MATPEPTNELLTQDSHICIICNGKEGPLTDTDSLRQASEKAITNLLESADDREDEAACRLRDLQKLQKLESLKYHAACRSKYVAKDKRNVAKKRRLESANMASAGTSSETKRPSRYETGVFDWNLHCFICGGPEDKKHGKTFTMINMRPNNVRENSLAAAKIRHDEEVVIRLQFQTNLFACNGRYHADCYRNYISKKALDALKTGEGQRGKTYKEIALKILSKHEQVIKDGELILLPTIASEFRQEAIQLGIPENDAMKIRSFYIKDIICSVGGDNIAFHSHKGLPDIMCSPSITLQSFRNKAIQIAEQDFQLTDIDRCEEENLILHRAATIVRAAIDKIVVNTSYATPLEVLHEFTETFIPKQLQIFLGWTLDKKSLIEADPECQASTPILKRRCFAIAESIIYCSRRAKPHLTPPLHLALVLHLHHKHGGRDLIETLNSFGFCATYHELCTFLTSAAEQQLKTEALRCIPVGIIPRTEGGGLIHEGDDNIDIPVQTIDGKNTYHSMARVIFQDQAIGTQTEVPRIPKGRNESLKANTSQFAIMPFKKPTENPEFPKFQNAVEDIEKLYPETTLFNPSDFLWLMLRFVSRGVFNNITQGALKSNQTVPFWTGFHTSITNASNVITLTAYAPTVEAKPSDLATLYTTLKKGQEAATACGQNYHIHTFDMQLYIAAQFVKNSKPDEFKSLILRAGGFHCCVNYIPCIGKLWGDGGLLDILVQSGVYAGNTASLMLAGKQFHRAIRGLTLVFEAMSQLYFENFLIWATNTHLETCQELYDHVNTVPSQLQEMEDQELLAKKLSDSTTFIQEKIVPLLEEFKAWGESKSATFAYWAYFLRAVSLLLLNIRAEREGDWEMHLQSLAGMLPTFAVCDRHNYSRYTPLYLLEMINTLPDEVKERFMKGEFAVKFTPGPFRGLWSDMGVEMSVIRDSKSSSHGIIGFSSLASAVLRWTLTRQFTGMYSKSIKIRSGQSEKNDFFHEQQSPAVLKRDERDVGKIISHVRNNMIDPFSNEPCTEHLQNIATGLTADPSVEASLLQAPEKGKAAVKKFLAERFHPENSTDSIFGRLKKSGLRTFADMKKGVTISRGDKKIKTTVAASTVYQRGFALSKSHPEVSLETMLEHPITATPPALFNEDGTMRHGKKADLLHRLEREIKDKILKSCPPELETTNANNTDPIIYVIDVMAELQKMNTKSLRTFDDVGQTCLNIILRCLEKSSEVHFIGDRYDDEISPKSIEHERRYGFGGPSFVVSGNRPVPDLKSFLSNDKNKSALSNFISEYIEKNAQKSTIMQNCHEKCNYLAGGYTDRTITKRITAMNVQTVPEAASNHSEADTRIIFHISYAMKKHAQPNVTIIVRSPDTDVFVLLVAFYGKLLNNPKVWFETGTSTAKLDLHRYIPVHKLCRTIPPEFAAAMPALHALTGCDVVSQFCNKGKITAYDKAKKLPAPLLNSVAAIGSTASVNSQIVTCREVTVRLYERKKITVTDRTSDKAINRLRVLIATRTNLPIEKLPPPEPALLQHSNRAIWQAHQWYHADQSNIPPLDPLQYGFELSNGKIVAVNFKGKTSLEILQDYFCACGGKQPCSHDTCRCKRNGINCCEVCACFEKEKCCNEHGKDTDNLVIEDQQEDDDLPINDEV